MEEFRKIKGYDYYEVSNYGRVRSLERMVKNKDSMRIVRGGILKAKSLTRYLTVGVRINGKARTKTIHQLVAIAFLNHEPNGHFMVVDHIDNNPHNNHVENLQLITQAENLLKQDRYKHLRLELFSDEKVRGFKSDQRSIDMSWQ